MGLCNPRTSEFRVIIMNENSIPFSLINYAAHCPAWIRYGKRLWPRQWATGWESTIAVYYVAEGEVGGSKICSDFPACVSLSKCPET